MAERGEEEKGVVEEGMAVVDFDMLCATVALQAQGFSAERRAKSTAAEEEEDGDDYGGVQRMWEGDVLDCFEDRRIAIEAACCPCYRFGKNMRRANLGSCFLQGTVYFMIRALTLFSLIAFGITKWHVFVYTGVGSACLMGVYLGYFRTRIRKQFNIRGSDSSVDDCVNHLICPCCTLCQESRTLEMNNVHSGVWHGRGETICLGSGIGGEGIKPSLLPIRSPELCSMERASNTSELLPIRSPELCSMERASNTSEHSWNADTSQSNPLVAATQSVQVL